jgi:uncharacterized membrane protein YfcA
MDLHFVIGGALVGFIVGATGVGGGSLMTPLLTLVFHVPAQVAVGTDLLFAAVTKANGAWVHAKRGSVDWPITGWLAAGSVPAALVTLVAVRQINFDPRELSAIVSHTLGGALLVTALALVFKVQVVALGRRFAPGPATLQVAGATGPGSVALSMGPEDGARPLPTFVVGVVIGTLVTLTSVGAGVIGVVALFFLYPTLAPRRIVASDIAHAVPLTLVAGLGHASLGTVNFSMLGSLLLGSLPAIMLGAKVAHRLPERALRFFLSAMLVFLGVRLLLAG